MATDAEFAGDVGAYPRQRRLQDPNPGSSGLVSANQYKDNICRKYKGERSVNLGLAEIFLQTLAIVLNGVGVGLQGTREQWISNAVFMALPSVWTGVFVYLAASFAIAAGKYKYKGLIITHMVLAIIGSVFAFVFFSFACGAAAFELEENSRDFGSAIVAGIWLLLSLTMFIMLIWGSALCCQVLSCGEQTDTEVVTMSTDIHNKPGGLLTS